MPRNHIALPDWGYAKDVDSGKFCFKRDEVLFGKLRPYFHKVGFPCVAGVCSTDILVIAPKERHWFAYSLLLASSAALVAHVVAASDGTKMPRANWNDLVRFSTVLPTEQVAAAFDAVIRPYVEFIREGILSSRTLAELRDTLLPKLISGELRIKDAEKLASDAL